MKHKLIPQSPVKLQKEIHKLHVRRKNRKKPSKRNSRLTKDERLTVFNKTNGCCHVCGKKLLLNDFQTDHVVSHISGGSHDVNNYLPACFICNNYRWHYGPEELQFILKICVWAKSEIVNWTTLGSQIASKYVKKEIRRMSRTSK